MFTFCLLAAGLVPSIAQPSLRWAAELSYASTYITENPENPGFSIEPLGPALGWSLSAGPVWERSERWELGTELLISGRGYQDAPYVSAGLQPYAGYAFLSHAKYRMGARLGVAAEGLLWRGGPVQFGDPALPLLTGVGHIFLRTGQRWEAFIAFRQNLTPFTRADLLGLEISLYNQQIGGGVAWRFRK
jgi:hypothetical protein